MKFIYNWKILGLEYNQKELRELQRIPVKSFDNNVDIKNLKDRIEEELEDFNSDQTALSPSYVERLKRNTFFTLIVFTSVLAFVISK